MTTDERLELTPAPGKKHDGRRKLYAQELDALMPRVDKVLSALAELLNSPEGRADRGVQQFYAELHSQVEDGRNILLARRREIGEDAVMGTLTLLEAGLKAMVLARKQREEIADEFKAAGLDGNGRFEKAERGYAKALDVLAKHGIELDDVVSSHLFRPDSGTVRVDLAWTNTDDAFSPTPIPKVMLVLSWHKLAEDKFEVVAYLS